jgi:hypothetical protein
VRAFRADNSLTLTAAVCNKKDVRFAVEFVIKDTKQLRNSKSIELFLLKHSNVEIVSVSIQAAFNFDSDNDDALSSTAVFTRTYANTIAKYKTAEPSFLCR